MSDPKSTASSSSGRKMVDATWVRSPIADRYQENPISGPKRLVHPVDRIDIARGWPPQILGAVQGDMVSSGSSSMHFTARDQRRSLEAALANPEVRAFLDGRWEVLGCGLVGSRADSMQARACLFNYTTNQLIEVYVDGDRVSSIALRESHEYPEAPIEMAQAIALARAHPELRKEVETLDAHAILQIPRSPHSASCGHRCLLVIFTDQHDRHSESPAQYSAVVDLQLQAVLEAGPAPCDAGSSATRRKPSSVT
jgi:hypothetical protein